MNLGPQRKTWFAHGDDGVEAPGEEEEQEDDENGAHELQGVVALPLSAARTLHLRGERGGNSESEEGDRILWT